MSEEYSIREGRESISDERSSSCGAGSWRTSIRGGKGGGKS
jgi:hypothetical protein